MLGFPPCWYGLFPTCERIWHYLCMDFPPWIAMLFCRLFGVLWVSTLFNTVLSARTRTLVAASGVCHLKLFVPAGAVNSYLEGLFNSATLSLVSTLDQHQVRTELISFSQRRTTGSCDSFACYVMLKAYSEECQCLHAGPWLQVKMKLLLSMHKIRKAFDFWLLFFIFKKLQHSSVIMLHEIYNTITFPLDPFKKQTAYDSYDPLVSF